MKTVEIYVNGYAYRFGKSTFTSDHGALLMIKDGKVINEWNTYREWDSIKTSPDLLLAYEKLVAASKIEGIVKTYNIGDKVKIGTKSGVISQIFPGDDVTNYEVTYTDGSFSIEAI